MFSCAKVNAALGGSGVRFGLAESIPVVVSIAVATCGCEICIEPCGRRCMCHFKYWAWKPRRLILYFAVRVVCRSSCIDWVEATERKSSMLMATTTVLLFDFLKTRHRSTLVRW